MQKKIYYNQTNNQASLDQKTGVNSVKSDRFNQPIFDFNDKEGCVISITSDQQSLKCFAKEKITDFNSGYHQGYVKVNDIIDGIVIFDCYQVEKNLDTNKGEKPKGL